MFSKMKEAGRLAARSNKNSTNPPLETPDCNNYNIAISENSRHGAIGAETARHSKNSIVRFYHSKMDKRPPLRKRGSSLFYKMTAQETYDSLVPRSTSSSRTSERTIS